MATTWETLASMLFGQVPHLVVSFGGIILCLVMWRRYPTPALLAFLGCVLVFTATLGVPVAQILAAERRTTTGTLSTQYVRAISTIGLVASVVRAAGIVLLLCGVFASRQPQSLSAFPVRNVGGNPPPFPPPR